MKTWDVIIIGAGQSGLATAYFLKRTGLEFLILDDQSQPGGSWPHTWDSLHLFSPSEYSSIPGWQMPKEDEEYPSKDAFVAYLTAYEQRYGFNVERPVRVAKVTKNSDGVFEIETDGKIYLARAVISATGTAQNPVIPNVPGQPEFEGAQLHSMQYRNADAFAGGTVAIVGAGNSGAQILADVAEVANTIWITQDEPAFNPDDVDGRFIFDAATRRFYDMKADRKPQAIRGGISLGNIVMVESVKAARERGDVLHAVRPFERMTKTGAIWPDGTSRDFDAIIWCTGFSPNLAHLADLIPLSEGKAATQDTRALDCENLWLVGYGGWTGYASATIFGVQKTARDAVRQIQEALRE